MINRKEIERLLKEYSMTEEEFDSMFGYCLVVGIDEYGNSIIDNFIELEKSRHIKKRKEEFNNKSKYLRFSKYLDGYFFPEIYTKRKNLFVIIIGETKNSIAKKIISKYADNESNHINIIEVYQNDIDIQNIKLITQNKEEIYYLLRLITYIVVYESFFGVGDLMDVIASFPKKIFENKKIKMNCFKVNNDLSNINELEIPNNLYLIQIATDLNHTVLDIGYLSEYFNKLDEKLMERANDLKESVFDDIEPLHTHLCCNFHDYEIYTLRFEDV